MTRDARLRDGLVQALLVGRAAELDAKLAGEILERWDELIEKERAGAGGVEGACAESGAQAQPTEPRTVKTGQEVGLTASARLTDSNQRYCSTGSPSVSGGPPTVRRAGAPNPGLSLSDSNQRSNLKAAG